MGGQSLTPPPMPFLGLFASITISSVPSGQSVAANFLQIPGARVALDYTFPLSGGFGTFTRPNVGPPGAR